MAKKSKPQRDPSDCVHDIYRSKNAGVVNVPMNDKPYDDNFHLDRSTLGTHPEWNPTKGKYGQYVEVEEDILKNVRSQMGELKHRSSSRRDHGKANIPGAPQVPTRRY